MTTTSNVSNPVSNSLLTAMNGTSATSSGSATASGSSVSAMQSQFMNLLVTQLKNQDPLNPMNNTQITSQLAQLSTVQGVQQLNSTLTSLMSSYQASQSLQASNMIGHNVLANGSTLSYTGSATNFGVNLASAADSVSVNLVNSSGQVVDSMNLGAQPGGVIPLQWSGTNTSGQSVPTGNYTIQVTATASGKSVSAQPLVYGQVTSVLTGANGAQLEVSGLGTVGLSTVAQVF